MAGLRRQDNIKMYHKKIDGEGGRGLDLSCTE